MSDQPDDVEAADSPTVDTQATTMLNKDYLGRALANAIPGTTNAKDYLGRDIKAGNLDYLGRQLVA